MIKFVSYISRGLCKSRLIFNFINGPIVIEFSVLNSYFYCSFDLVLHDFFRILYKESRCSVR